MYNPKVISKIVFQKNVQDTDASFPIKVNSYTKDAFNENIGINYTWIKDYQYF